ncbi:MAG TPA: lytic transglycosylase domain-containing protein [Ideonella sp.]|nr:lytic transglycosylase domain-containing protein [Ideonella sp.]
MTSSLHRTLLALALAGSLPPAHATGGAEVWGYVDAAGVAHFADHAIDSRYMAVLRGQGTAGPRVPGKTMTSDKLLTWLEFAPEVKAVQPWLREAEAATGIDAELLKAVITVESGYKADSVSPRGAVGLMQITPVTAERYLTREEIAARPVNEHLRDARSNILIGARMLADLWHRFGGVHLALAAWNAGESRVRGGQMPQIAETRSHVHQVLELYWVLLQQRQFMQAQPGSLALRLVEPGATR